MQALGNSVARVILVPTSEGVKVEHSGRHGSIVLTTAPDIDSARQYVEDTYGRVKFTYDQSIGLESALV